MKIGYNERVLKAMEDAVVANPDLQEAKIDDLIILVNPDNDDLMAYYEHQGHHLVEYRTIGDRLFAIFL